MDHLIPGINSSAILDSLSDGVYVTDRDRVITHWNKAAEQITGWKAEEVIGRSCRDNILVHVDKDGRHLCGKSSCPLHRTIQHNCSATFPIIVFAKRKDGSRIPLQVKTSPIRDAEGNAIGGVESFRDMTPLMYDLNRAKRIQENTMRPEDPDDPRISLQRFYAPNDIIGGDFYLFVKRAPGEFTLFLCDVMGHGVASALYTMYIRSIWEEHQQYMSQPEILLDHINASLHHLVQDDHAFATGVVCDLDLNQRTIRYAGAGAPPIFLFDQEGKIKELECCGYPLGLLPEGEYEVKEASLEGIASLFLFSDGAIEVHNDAGEELGVSGLIEILKRLNFPEKEIALRLIDAELLKHSRSVRLDDDLTLLDLRFNWETSS